FAIRGQVEELATTHNQETLGQAGAIYAAYNPHRLAHCGDAPRALLYRIKFVVGGACGPLDWQGRRWTEVRPCRIRRSVSLPPSAPPPRSSSSATTASCWAS